jgi:nucleoside-diphosphate-sugar epimerase
MKVFLTGATGFLGSALVQRFVANVRDVVCFVRKESDSLPAGVKQMVGDLASLSRSENFGSSTESSRNTTMTTELNHVLSDCAVVVHAAARAHIMRDEVSDPLTEYRKVNRDATLALARLAAEAGVKRFVFVSSVKVNGESTKPNQPFKPQLNFVPDDPYGLSKYEAEQGLLKIADETGMEIVIVRPPLVYGPNVKGNFASMVKWMKKGIPLPLGAVRNLRSLVALDNLVDFIALCADRERSPKAVNEVFLISDGEDVSTSELLRKVARAFGAKSRLLPIPDGLMKFSAKLLGKGAVGDRLFGNLQVDSSKAQNLLGWKPVVTMDEQLSKMVKNSD